MNNINKWSDFIYDLKDNEILSNYIVEKALSLYWEKVICKLDIKDYIHTQFKIGIGNQYRSISVVQTHNKTDFNEINESFKEFLNMKFENMMISDSEIEDIDKIIFTYKVLSPDSNIEKGNIHLPNYEKAVNEIDIEKKKTFKVLGYNLPSTMDITTWGTIEYNKDNLFIIKKYQSIATYYTIKILDDYLEVEMKINNRIILKFKDYPDKKSESPLINFRRVVREYEYYLENGKVILFTKLKKTEFLSIKKKDKILSKNIITMDIETQAIDGFMWPYCISIYDGKNKPISFFITDYKDNIELMINESIKYLMIKDYNKYKVYIHNFSYFDSIFLIKSLYKLGDKIKPIIRDGRFIDFEFIYNKKYSLRFRDSMLLLPSALSKLAINFNLENKGIFPYNFLDNKYNNKVNLDYIGKVPRFKFFNLNNIIIKDFIKYMAYFKNRPWNLKFETIKYSELDVKILYDILIKFNEIIYSKFNVDAFKYSTISSLAFAIFRTNYLKNHKIPLITGKIYDDLKPSYTGGGCDVYKPFSFEKKKIYGYDVNSLYPYVMGKELMPVGNPIYFEGDITKIKDNPFGFFEVEINAPEDLYTPLLQTRLKTENGKRTVSPVGNWIGTYFTEELKEAIKLGYSIKILRGYLFEKDIVFDKFISDLYLLKQNSNKDSADYIIYKLLMNSLYGRFGMSPKMESHIILDSNTAEEKYLNNNKYIVTNTINLDNNKELLSFYKKYDNELNKVNISIPIASAITAYSRIFMSKFKISLSNNLYYSDTDSLYLDTELDPKYVSDSILGKFKLEKIFEKALFLAPKMYAGKFINKNGKLDQFIKIKGVKININFIKLIPLLFKDKHLNLVQEKWIRDIDNSTIKKDYNTKHTLKLSSFKRNIIYRNKIFINTKPLKLKNCKID
jgi:DNA polymerase type B, organellar and viral